MYLLQNKLHYLHRVTDKVKTHHNLETLFLMITKNGINVKSVKAHIQTWCFVPGYHCMCLLAIIRLNYQNPCVWFVYSRDLRMASIADIMLWHNGESLIVHLEGYITCYARPVQNISPSSPGGSSITIYS